MLPDITTLQFFILRELMDGELAGHELRNKLSNEGAEKSGPAFYQLMSRLEEAKLVKGYYEKIKCESGQRRGQIVRERRYEITGDGLNAVEEFQLFVNRGLTFGGSSDGSN